MASYDVHLTKGQTASVVFTVEEILTGETVATATLSVRTHEGATTELFNKVITTASTSAGQVTNTTGTATLTFLLSAANTNTLVTTKPYCVYSVSFTTSGGGLGVTIPAGVIYTRDKV